MVALRREEKRLVNVLIVGTDFPPNSGGISTYSREIAQVLTERCSVTVLAPGATGSRAFDETFCFEVVRTPNIPFLRTLAFLVYVPWLLVRKRTDLVLHTVWTTALASHMWHRFFRAPYFVSVHASEILDDNRSIRRRIKGYLGRWRRAALRRAAGIFPVSRYTARLIEGFGVAKARIRVITHGVDPVRFYPGTASDSSGDGGLLTVARLDLHKGHDKVLEALARLRDERLSPRYTIVGEGEERARLARMTQALGLQEQVTFAGFVSDEELLRAYADAEVFIMASREIPGRQDLIEGFGLSFLEASASGLPVIAGRSGGVPDAVLDGKTGLLVDPCDVGDIARAIKCLVTDRERARRMGEKGRKWVEEEMNWDRAGGTLLDAMQELSRDRLSS
ncbi:hypothetical protein D3OALGB2SA_5287 [Olavius algarvensis associated proteobacterium Delta 3]|nr:hypothetical protein D3OALGB2SA_5287 [Olavius algarvensis associated proteobacterium Delta 3]